MTISAEDFFDTVMGLPYDEKKLHCYELVRRCQSMVFGRELPPVAVRPDNMRELIDMMELRKTYYGWQELAEPVHGAVVFMTKGGHEVSNAACHIGVWFDFEGGGVLHTDGDHGVVFDSLPALAVRNWGDFSYYAPSPPPEE